MSLGTALDRIIAAVAPEAGLRRAAARLRLAAAAAATMHYEGAARGRRTDGWRAVTTDAPGAQRGQLARLRSVAAGLVRNDAWARRGIDVLVNNVVGPGIVASVDPASGTAPARKRAEAIVAEHFGTSAIDADGRHDLAGLQRLMMGGIAASGEVILRKRARRLSDGLPVPLQVQVLEPDYLDESKDGPTEGGGTIVQGVEFDALGRRAAYWLFDQHPGSLSRWSRYTSRRIPADYVAHVYREDHRASQVRGVPWLAPVVVRLQDLHEFEDYQLIRQKVAACLAAFVHDPQGVGALPLGAAGPSDAATGLEEDQLAPGMIVNLPNGKQVTFSSPPSLGGQTDYVDGHLRAVAVALGITFEALTGNLSNVNFSSGRMGWLEMARAIDAARWGMLIPQGIDRIGRWVIEAASIAEPQLARVRLSWTPPRRDMIAPEKEIPALRDAVLAGFTSRTAVVREMGEDPDAVLAEIAAEQKAADAAGVRLASDLRWQKSGATAAADPNPAADPPAPGAARAADK